jgi:ABC-type iron transport system FetAB ATPase subunit
MTIGTLRDQIIYPDCYVDMQHRAVNDNHLRDLLDRVQLTYLMERDGSLNAVQDWMDVLSGGEKQRIAVSLRLMTHISIENRLGLSTVVLFIELKRWLVSSITSHNSLFSTNVQVLYHSMLKDTCTNIVVQ